MKRIVLRGDCLVGRVRVLHQLLVKYLDEGVGRLEIDTADVDRCDLSFFQLICSACRGFSDKNQTVIFPNPLPAAVVDQFKKAGFEAACTDCSRQVCIFKQSFLSGEAIACPAESPLQPERTL